MAKSRIHNPRWLWVTAGLVGAICIVGFVMMLLADPDASTTPAPQDTSGRGFGAGLLVGLGAGIAIGVAIKSKK